MSEPQASSSADAAASAGESPRCEACASGRLAPDRVKTALWAEDRLVVVEDVPALVCDTCAERFFDDETAMRLDMLRGGGFSPAAASREMRVPVFRFGDDG